MPENTEIQIQDVCVEIRERNQAVAKPENNDSRTFLEKVADAEMLTQKAREEVKNGKPQQ